MKKISKNKIITALIAILILAYVGFNLYYSSSSSLKTETVVYTEATNSYETNAYIIRNEEIINYDSSKVIKYVLEDSQAVAQGANVAYLFDDSEDAKAFTEIENLNQEIRSLEQINIISNQNTTNPDLIDEQIGNSIQDLGVVKDFKSFPNIYTIQSDLLYYLNERQLITGKTQNFDSRINQLENRINEINVQYPKGKTGVVDAPSAGYFVSIVDGYENSFDYNNVKNLTVSEIKSGLEGKKTDVESPAGKIITGLNWYVACNMSMDESVKLPQGKEILLSMPFASMKSIPATVESVNPNEDRSEAAVIFKCNYMNKELSHTRYEKIKIESDKYKGFKIPKAAIHIQSITRTIRDENNNQVDETRDVQGVYAVYGSELRFKQIIPLNSYSDFVICSADAQEQARNLFADSAVQLYDEVVIGGVDLYDGKLIK